MRESELVHFGDLVADRRKELALTLKQLSETGGPSDVTTGKIEHGAIEQPSARTLRRLDAGLRWKEGSAAKALRGGNPIPLEDLPTSTTSAGGGAVGAGTDSVTLSLAVVSDLSNIAKRYEGIAERLGLDELAAVNADLDVLVDRILRSWVISQLEMKAGADRDKNDFLVEMLIGDYLDRKPVPADKSDELDLLYMRWLTG
ncbi:helix-turn-helix domain-containing protein, partial [Rhodococcus marinonascens]|uniref:helix-turn-helix domain-containing protein n=1 Tax=Rhodococcus marinonascens TaxID=38311 RepID=UPI0009344C85